MKSQSWLYTFAGLALLVVMGVVGQTYFSVVPEGQTVWVPDYGTVSCEVTRLECYPGPCSDTNPVFKDIPQSGYSYWCGSPTLSDANYYEGCEFVLKASSWSNVDFTSVKICDGDGSNCASANLDWATSTWGTGTKYAHVPAGKKLYVNPSIATYEISGKSKVYGLTVAGSIKPQFSDRCNIASLLNADQIATLKGSSDYAETIAAGEINPGNFPIVFITGYKESYKDQRVMVVGGDSWFVEDIGLRCKVEQDTSERWIVTDDCVSDNSIECFPNILNCGKNGQLMTSSDPSQQSCVPGTLIGSSTERTAISATEACRIKCGSDGVPEHYDCIVIESCSDGKVLNQDYECVDSTKLTEKERCEAGGGRYSQTTLSDGTVEHVCDYSPGIDSLFLIGVIGVVVFIVLIMIIVRAKRGR